MEKIYGTTIRQDGLQKIGRDKWQLFYGLYKDESGSYEYRHVFHHKPTQEEVKHVIHEQVNANVEELIRCGFKWNGISVYLSEENQRNFKAAYDLAYQMQGATLPVKFKLGETADEEAVYYSFADMETFTDFHTQAIAHINECLNNGWIEKDNIDWSKFACE